MLCLEAGWKQGKQLQGVQSYRRQERYIKETGEVHIGDRRGSRQMTGTLLRDAWWSHGTPHDYFLRL